MVVTITGSGGDQVVGENYTLTCQVTGGVATASSHRWLSNGSLLNDTSAMLFFSPLSETDSGVYICEGTRSSITRTSANFTISVAGEFQMYICEYKPSSGVVLQNEEKNWDKKNCPVKTHPKNQG